MIVRVNGALNRTVVVVDSDYNKNSPIHDYVQLSHTLFVGI